MERVLMVIDLKQERIKFEAWWRAWCPNRKMPSVASHIFDGWLARSRAVLADQSGSREGLAATDIGNRYPQSTLEEAILYAEESYLAASGTQNATIRPDMLLRLINGARKTIDLN